MTGDTVGKVSDEYRRKRVRRIKRIIIMLVVILLLLPTCLSVYLIFRVSSLEKRLDVISDMQNQSVSETQVDVEEVTAETEAVSGGSVSGGASDISEATPIPQGLGKKVYLTFDDGPGPNTKKLLDILKKNEIKATFFVTGKTDDFSKEIYKRIVEEGHTLGMHSYSHVYEEIYASEKAFAQDLDKIYGYLYDVTGVYPKFYRFPGGSSVQDTSVPIEDLISILEERGITYLDWNVISPDIRDSSVGKVRMIKELMSDVQKYETSVVMFYDTQTQPMTIKTLTSFIKKLKKNQYEILPVDENTAPIRHNQ